MRSILEELHSGNIFPDELIIPKDPEYRLINQKIGDNKEYFKKKLPEDEYRRFEELDNLCCQSSSMCASESFIYGFKLGALIMVEVFTGKGELVRGGD
jgi:hypothetical protein